MVESVKFFGKKFGRNVQCAAFIPLLSALSIDCFISAICIKAGVFGFFKKAHFPIPSTKNDESFKRRALAVAMRMLAVLCALPLILTCAVCAVVIAAVVIPMAIVMAALVLFSCLFIGIPLFIILSIHGWRKGKEFNLDEEAGSIFASPKLGDVGALNGADVVEVALIFVIIPFAIVISPVVVPCMLVVALPALFYVAACALASKIAHAAHDAYDKSSPYDLEGDVVSVDKKFPFKNDDFKDSELLKATYSLATDPFVCRS